MTFAQDAFMMDSHGMYSALKNISICNILEVYS